MTDRELMQMALDALEANLGKWAAKTKAIAALRERLAQPEHEPVSLNDGRLTQYPDGSIGVGTRYDR